MLAPAARLARVTRVNLDDFNPACFGFVCQKAMELSKRPRVHTALSFPFFVGDTLPNIGQVLNHNGTARRGVLNNALGEDMVVISSLPKQFTGELTQVAFCALCAFGLKLTTEAKDAAFLFLPSAISQEAVIGSHGGAIQPKINPDHIRGCINNLRREIHNDVEKVAPVMETQVSRTNLTTNVAGCMFGDSKTYLNTTRYSGKATSE
jgi:hypothetical protein